jgi:leucine dehydrogenase
MGAIWNHHTIEELRAGIVCGAANNQLASAQDGALLQDRGVLYCPDFLVNAGGIIDVHHQRIGSSARVKRAQIGRIETILSSVLQRADEQQRQPQLIAEELAEEYLANAANAAPLKAAC